VHITYHAGERFLQRVFQMTDYTKKQVFNAMRLLKKDLMNVSTTKSRFILPSFPDFLAIRVDKTLVTIIPK